MVIVMIAGPLLYHLSEQWLTLNRGCSKFRYPLETRSLPKVSKGGLDRPDRAAASFSRALEHEPDNAIAHAGLAEIAYRRGARREAFEHYRAVVRYDPDNGLAWYRLAVMIEQTAKRRDALWVYRRAAEILPPESELGQRVSIKIGRIDPPLPARIAQSWGELARQVTGPVLVVLFALLIDHGLRPWWITAPGWLASLLAVFGALLYASGSSLPANPLLRLFSGPQTELTRSQKTMSTWLGCVLV
jgi:tetratricopeptide (TPR) repeat protein